MSQVTHYNSISDALGFETRPFNEFHAAESQNTLASRYQYRSRDVSVSLSRSAALELVNKWNKMTGKGGVKYSI